MSEITSKHSMFQSFQDGFRVACVELRSLDKIRQKLYSTMSESDSKLDLEKAKNGIPLVVSGWICKYLHQYLKE